MSKKGLQEVAEILSTMQQKRIELLKGDSQDMMLSNLLDNMKELAAPRFEKITLMK